MENQKQTSLIKKVLIIAGSLIVCAGMFLGGVIAGKNSLGKEIDSLKYVLDIYHKYYYEESDDVLGLISDALFDQYSTYYTAEEYDLIKKSAQGQREGFGVSFLNGSNVIYSVKGNSPAFKAGIKKGGKITGIRKSGESNFTTINSYDDLTREISLIGAYTDTDLRVDYKGVEFTYTLQKQAYTETFVFYYDNTGEYVFSDENGQMEFLRYGDNTDYPITTNSTAVIKYTGFSGTQKGLLGSAGQFARALEKFRADGKRSLVIDLRDNGGGYMSILTQIAAHLIDGGEGEKKLISVAVDKYGTREEFLSTQICYDQYSFENIVFLANDNSASASEALMGAVLDYDKKGIVSVVLEGKNGVFKSYGKGIMQSTFERPFTGEAVKVTTAKLYWPITNTCIHGVGLIPGINGLNVIAESAPNNAFIDALSIIATN